ncbi:hypothetical protein OHA71_23725 [Streptomyces sp. NBC_00444]|uniref:hypothetical protein n=1 Tax=Streptomyces sp. NBC_00444 TaxID=2975744 RepID=UPI002E1A49F4
MTTTLAAGLEQYTAQSVTTAGFGVGLALLIVEHWRWYKGSGGGGGSKGKGGGEVTAAARDPKALIPYWFGFVFGVLMVACPAGLLGTVADVLRWGGNGAGGWVMSTMTGQHATAIGQAGAPGLDQYGATVVTVLVLALFWQRKKIAKAIKGTWKKGLLTGVLLCITTGTAALLAQTIVGSTNDIGRFLFDTVTTGTLV